MNFIKTNLWEINRSTLLHQFGAILSLLHIVNYFFWLNSNHFLTSPESRPLLCWPFFSRCTEIAFFNHVAASTILSLYVVLSGLALISFLWQRFIGLSWFFLLLASFIQAFFYVIDASLSHDIFTLILFLNFGFLFIPSKISLIRAGVIIYYIVLGYKELSPEWLSGSVLHASMPLPFKILEWVAAVGLIIKFTLPFLLVSPIGQRLALGVAGLLLYNGFHFYFLHDYQSLTLTVLTLYFILDHFYRKKIEREALYQSYAHPEPTRLWWSLVAGVFIFIQTPFAPRSWPTEVFKVTGPDYARDCRTVSFAYYDKKVEQVENLLPQNTPGEIACHPLVVFNSAKDFCRSQNSNTNFRGLSLFFLDRGLTDEDYKTIFSLKNICDDNIQFQSYGMNP